jgi:alkanesulfonate monooxygenase SsuD/methylene tetrahydromethanopterin reductase-like flavin-dependent oxidoreductase (luciferase family)
MKAMWTEDEVTYEGEYYNLRGAISQPKPVQQPHIPLWVAGGGEKVTLNIAARHAQYTNFGGDALENFTRKSEILEAHCDDVGTDFDGITRSANFNVLCAETEARVQEKKDWLFEHLNKYVSEERAKRSASLFDGTSGTPEQIIAWLKDYEAAGLGYTIIQFAEPAYDRSGLELFAKEVIPAFG